MGTISRSDWITGEEIMQGGVLAPSLGMACHEGILKAYMPEFGDKREIMDFPQLKCWPKYPSPLENHRNHIKSASSSFWDWDKILKIPELQQEISDIERQLSEIDGFPVLSEEQKQLSKELNHNYLKLQRELKIKTQPNPHARRKAVSMIARANEKNLPDIRATQVEGVVLDQDRTGCQGTFLLVKLLVNDKSLEDFIQ